jgi:hypothetical protein
MRLWLKDSERRPDPAPVRTDDRKAVLTGLVLWLVAVIVLLFFTPELAAAGHTWWLATCASGLGLGLIALVYTNRRHN